MSATVLCPPSSVLSKRPPRTGWGHTRGWSKKLHYFEERRAHCSGSTQRDNEPLIPTAEATAGAGDPICVDCLNYATGNQRDNHQRGTARPNYNSRTRKISHR